ncbi:MAG TPA: M20/M25/M40 family metallo-hydrolase [Candidatus Dormibacteraeota bacterium]|nr:M20/M25/M40 family metallo-hydrolase [Candidatus Dormibacteraeota bacterium]
MSIGTGSDRTDPVALLERLVAVPSDRSEEALQRLLASLLTPAGFRVRLQPVAPGRLNLLAVRGRGGPVLCTHADTVPPLGHPDPYRLRRTRGRLVGRGVVDAKGQLAAAVAAALASDRPLALAVTADEEGDGRGSRRLHLPASARRDGVLVLEPTGLALCTEQVGFLDLELSARGRSGHVDGAASPGPLEAVLEAIDVLRGHPLLARPDPRHGPPWLRVTVIEAGDDAWRLPARARALVHLALLPGTPMEEVRRAVHGLTGPRVRVRLDDEGPPVSSPASPVGEAARAALRAVTGEAPSRLMRSWTDAQHLAARGYPWAVLGAGELDSAHSTAEWLAERDLRTLFRVLLRLVEDWAAGWRPGAQESGAGLWGPPARSGGGGRP